jgi:hypothetical protein
MDTTEVKVRIPSNLPSGNFKALIYYENSYRRSCNFLDFWVTAASVPAVITDPYEAQVRSFRVRYGKSVLNGKIEAVMRRLFRKLKRHCVPSI